MFAAPKWELWQVCYVGTSIKGKLESLSSEYDNREFKANERTTKTTNHIASTKD